MEIKPIAHIYTDFPEKFGIPRQSGLAKSLRGRIVFEPEYRNPDALRGLDGFSHIWLIWEFSANRTTSLWQPVVRPPRLGGNSFMGVFATRSPFRPNPLGLSCVKVDSIELSTPDGPVINVLGADLMDGTPIYDIKPYIRYADSRPEAVCGYVDALEERSLKVVFPSGLSDRIADKTIIPSLMETLRLDPRPSYHNDPERVYGLSFSGYNVRFKVVETVLTVTDIETLHLNGN
ncbi:MAG: tRNA (N6-threonylcarbamoyladenosine(37)-N6)-methyltransferase TrmO [Bacteroidales bacterium]|nr:tRNA (N6-threonylcarbamoyladenosine(37)-N6)-methyltransferase TrmO [Bacteroidales bacterium]